MTSLTKTLFQATLRPGPCLCSVGLQAPDEVRLRGADLYRIDVDELKLSYQNIMGGCQNYDPFLGTQNIRCRILMGIRKGTVILTTTHMGIQGSRLP